MNRHDAPVRLLFVMAYHRHDEWEPFQLILDRLDELVELRAPFSFLFVDSLGRKLVTRHPSETIPYADPPGLPKGLRIAIEWSMIARRIASHDDCTQWFWWEADVLPVRRDCFEFLLDQWTPRCQVMGYHVQDDMWGMRHRINGVAVYSRDYWRHLEPHWNTGGTFDTRRPFDPRTEAGLFVPINRWYCVVAHELRLFLTKEMRLVHGIRDDSLLRQVLDGTRTHPVVPAWFRRIRNRLVIAEAERRLNRQRPAESWDARLGSST